MKCDMTYLLFNFFLEIMDSIFKLIEDYSPEPFKIWMGPYFGVAIVKPEDIQVIIFEYNTNHIKINLIKFL